MKTRTSLKASIVIAAALVGAVVLATTVDAMAPGANGKIAFRTYLVRCSQSTRTAPAQNN